MQGYQRRLRDPGVIVRRLQCFNGLMRGSEQPSSRAPRTLPASLPAHQARSAPTVPDAFTPSAVLMREGRCWRQRYSGQHLQHAEGVLHALGGLPAGLRALRSKCRVCLLSYLQAMRKSCLTYTQVNKAAHSASAQRVPITWEVTQVCLHTQLQHEMGPFTLR